MKLWLIAWIAFVFAVPGYASNAGEYQLGPGDVIKISVYGNADLALEAPLSKKGELNFPLIGAVALGGMTLDQAERQIAMRLQNGGFVRSPQVSLIVTQYRSQLVSAIGELNRPGLIALDHPSDLLQVIAEANGISSSGSDTVVVIRGPQTLNVSLSKLMSEPDPGRRNIILSSGDVVYVPRSMIYVYGEVNRPGNFRLEPDMTVMQAISEAGGFTVKASRGSITIDHQDADGSVRKREAKLTDKLLNGDVVNIAESWF